MYKIKQKALKKILTILKPGVNKSISTRSGCVHFRKSFVSTESPFFSVHCPLNSGIKGSYPFGDFLKIVSQIKPSSEIELHPKPKSLQLIVANKNKKVQFSVKTFSQISESGMSIPKQPAWKELPDGFLRGLNAVQPIAKNTTSPSGYINCVYLTPNYFMATDGTRVVQYAIRNHLNSPVLIPANMIKDILKINPTSYTQRQTHLYFSTESGIVYDVAGLLDEFPKADHLFKVPMESEITVGEDFVEIAKSALSLGTYQLNIQFNKDQALLSAMSKSGPIKGICSIEYSGQPFSTKVRPDYLLDGLAYSPSFGFNADRHLMTVTSTNVKYLATTFLE